MIDLHTHILPGIDDGAATMEEALAMARLAVADGITHMVATPHGPGPDLETTVTRRQKTLSRLQDAIAEAAIPLTVLPGLEYCSDGNAIDNALRHPGSFLAAPPPAATRTLLLEIPPQISLSFIGHLLFKAQLQDINLILAHPERHQDFVKSLPLLQDLMDKGLFLQFNADNFTGGFFTRRLRKMMASAIRHNPDQAVIASDAHNTLYRPPVISCARQRVSAEFGNEVWERLTHHNPARILAITTPGQPSPPA